jgi:hypothetical protein
MREPLRAGTGRLDSVRLAETKANRLEG